jgi:dCMP deaminase
MSPAPRPEIDAYLMGFAQHALTRSTCASRQVGAVITQGGEIVTTGYNGAPRKQKHCTDPGVGCLLKDGRCIRSLHAEQNAITQAAKKGKSTEGATIYTTHRPCDACANLIVAAGIVRVVYLDGEPDNWGHEVLENAGVVVERLRSIGIDSTRKEDNPL